MIELVAQIHVETVVEMGVLALQRAGGCSLPKLVEELHICIAHDIEGRRPNRLTIDSIPSTDLLKPARNLSHIIHSHTAFAHHLIWREACLARDWHYV